MTWEEEIGRAHEILEKALEGPDEFRKLLAAGIVLIVHAINESFPEVVKVNSSDWDT